MNSRRMMLLGTTSIFVMLSGAAYAQNEENAVAADTSDTIAMEEVVATGIRSSLKKSLDVKRDSDGVIDVISAENIGKFPDKNVAESLQRVPGITVERQFGEGQAVSIRGASQNMTLTLLNGQNVASTGWFVFEPPRRSFNFSLLPSELVGNIKVYKSSQADLPEGGVGGTINISTRKPLDLKDLTIYGSAEATRSNDSGKVDPQFSGMVSWHNKKGNLGILVSGIYQRRRLQRQGNEAFWEWGAGPVGFQQDRKRSAYTATVQFQPNENLDLTVNYIKLKMKANNTNYALWLTQGNTSWSGVPVANKDKLNGTPIRGPLNVAFYQVRPREATMNSTTYDFNGSYTSDNYVVDFQTGFTKSDGGTSFEMVVNDGTGGTSIPGGTYDFSKGHQTWKLNGFNLATYDPGSLTMGTGSAFNKTPKTDQEYYGQFDVDYQVDLGVVKSIKTGFKYSNHNTTSRRFVFQQKAGFNPTISTSKIKTGTVNVGAGNFQILNVDSNALIAWAKASIIGAKEDLGSFSEIDETNLAGYVMASFEGEGFRGNAGVRYAHTKATSTFYIDNKWQTKTATYGEFLPSFNLAMDISDDVIFRTTAARVMTRPQYTDMFVNPNVTGTNDSLPNNQFWIIGNVGLKPFVSNQFDATVEWYFAKASLLSASFFIKDVKNFVSVNNSHASSAAIPFNLPNAAEQAAGWTVQQKVNGKSALVKGIELQYQQQFDNGFGLLLNYTFTSSNAEDNKVFSDGQTVMSDVSRHSANATGYYENDNFEARISYNYRSKYMLREIGAYGNRLHGSFGTVDLSASWYVTEQVAIKLDVNNLFQPWAKQFGNNAVAKPNSGFTKGGIGGFPLYEYETARRISLGVSFKY